MGGPQFWFTLRRLGCGIECPMVRRRVNDDFLLIAQTAHAVLSGTLAAAIGNDRFAPPSPFGPVVQAIDLHDAGWPTHDERPTVNAAGLPAHVLEMPLRTVLPIWAASTRIVAGHHPYAGLLVSLHGLGLSTRVSTSSAQELFELNRFQHEQVEIQERLRRELGLATDKPLRFGLAEAGRSPEEDLLLFNFRMLQFLDALSLDLCFDEVRFGRIENVFPRPGVEPIAMSVRRSGEGTFTVDPWPFGAAELSLKIAATEIEARRYADSDDFGRAFSAGLPRTIQIRVIRPAP
jgi:hypothetical protein